MSDKYQLQEVTVKEESSGTPFITLYLPKGWATDLSVDRTVYNGLNEPMNFALQCGSPDNQSMIWYHSNYHFRDSHMYPTKDYSTTPDGSLFYKFVPTKEFLEREITWRIGNNRSQFICYQDWPVDDAWLKEYQKWITENNPDPYTTVNDFYYKPGTIEYSFRSENNIPYRCVMSAIVEGADYTVWRSLPFEIQRMLNDPFSRDIGYMASSSYLNVRYDQHCNSWIYTADSYRDWYVSQMILMVMPEEEYEDQYDNIYLPIVSYGVHYTPELQKEMNSLQASINKEKKDTLDAAFSQPSPGSSTSSNYADAERRRQRDREAQEKLRKTREETAAIQNAMYENRQRSEARIREMRNDTMMGYTRYNDRYGSEHVIHSTDKYAYRKGDTYVTSNRPLDRGYDWEELEKKKY